MKIDRVLSHALQDAIAYVDGRCYDFSLGSLKPAELKELAELRARRQEYVRLLAKLWPQGVPASTEAGKG